MVSPNFTRSGTSRPAHPRVNPTRAKKLRKMSRTLGRTGSVVSAYKMVKRAIDLTPPDKVKGDGGLEGVYQSGVDVLHGRIRRDILAQDFQAVARHFRSYKVLMSAHGVDQELVSELSVNQAYFARYAEVKALIEAENYAKAKEVMGALVSWVEEGNTSDLISMPQVYIQYADLCFKVASDNGDDIKVYRESYDSYVKAFDSEQGPGLEYRVSEEMGLNIFPHFSQMVQAYSRVFIYSIGQNDFAEPNRGMNLARQWMLAPITSLALRTKVQGRKPIDIESYFEAINNIQMSVIVYILSAKGKDAHEGVSRAIKYLEEDQNPLLPNYIYHIARIIVTDFVEGRASSEWQANLNLAVEYLVRFKRVVMDGDSFYPDQLKPMSLANDDFMVERGFESIILLWKLRLKQGEISAVLSLQQAFNQTWKKHQGELRPNTKAMLQGKKQELDRQTAEMLA